MNRLEDQISKSRATRLCLAPHLWSVRGMRLRTKVASGPLGVDVMGSSFRGAEEAVRRNYL